MSYLDRLKQLDAVKYFITHPNPNRQNRQNPLLMVLSVPFQG